MARPLRVEYEGALYHLTGRGNRRERIFADEADRARFLALLVESLGRYGVELHAFVLLGNHYHLLARTGRANLGRWMHWLVTSYTIAFNRRHDRAGHLFQGRYKSILVEGGDYLLALSRYIHLNPVRGKRLGEGEVKERRERLREWRWSSYRGYAGLGRPHPMVTEELVLGELGGTKAGQRLRYRRFTELGLLEPILSPLAEAKWQAVLGSEKFQQRVRDKLMRRREQKEECKAIREVVASSHRLPEILRAVGRAYGLTAREVREQRGKYQEAKGVALTLAWDRCGMTLRELGTEFGGLNYAATAQQVSRTRERARAGTLTVKLDKLERDLSTN